jgi:dTDP-4-amino-4,6-dideoxygalactose transaminase
MINFNKPFITNKELKYIQDAISRGKLSGDGYYTKKCHEFIEKSFRTSKALLTTSCSSALDMAAILIDLKEGDEVIMPSYTFVSTANAVVLRGAKPVFAEIDEDTLNIDPKDIVRKITNKTKAIFPVHYAGVSCDMDSIISIAKSYNLMVVEDAAQGVNAKYNGKYLGTIGDIGCLSFHETKNYVCGEGGAILINQDGELAKRAEIIREKGTNRSQFVRGEVDKYTWVDIGSSYLPSDILAAMLYAQFENLDEINNIRKSIYNKYLELLRPLENKGLLKLPLIPKNCESNYHIFYILLNTPNERDLLMQELKSNGVHATFHYIPLHSSPMGRKFGYREGDLPLTEDISARLLRLPIHTGLKLCDVECIVQSIFKYMKVKV